MGTGHLRERAAFLFDQGFANVPETQIVQLPLRNQSLPNFSEDSLGSYQKYIPNTTGICKVPPSRINRIHSYEVHHIAILDIILLNIDRHLGNILIDKDNHIYPIDHSLILPLCTRGLTFGWMQLPQISWPMSRHTKKYISTIDIKENVKKLTEMNIEKESIQRMVISTHLLQKATQAGFTLFHIGKLMMNGTENLKGESYNNWRGQSFFEDFISYAILKGGQNMEVFLDGVIQKYRENHNIKEETEDLFAKENWTVEEIAKGVSLSTFHGDALEGKHEIYVIKIDNSQKNTKFTYRIRIIDARDYNNNKIDPKMPLNEVLAACPDSIAMINGGFFHFYHDKGRQFYYSWDSPYREGDPCGALQINGKVREVNPTNIGGLWGIFSSSIYGKPSIKEDHLEPLYENFESLGSSPILIKDGKMTNLQERASEIFKTSQALVRPGNFADHIFARHARSAVGIMEDDSILLVSVNGSGEGYSGMTGEELATLMDSLSAKDVLNMDGGGSTSMVLRRKGHENIETLIPKKIQPRRITSILSIEKHNTQNEI